MTTPVVTQLQGTKFLKTTGILDAYEHVIGSMIANGWPSDKTIFEHAAYEVLNGLRTTKTTIEVSSAGTLRGSKTRFSTLATVCLS